MNPKFFKSKNGNLPLPIFFPDATRAAIRTLDSKDILDSKTPGILVNTYHLYKDLDKNVLKNHGGVRGFMNFSGGIISDSGGFQVLTLAKNAVNKGTISDRGVTFITSGKRILFTPEISINFQMEIKPDMLITLDDFTEPDASYEKAKESVERTIYWAKKSKEVFLKNLAQRKIPDSERPYLLAVVQGGDFLELRKECAERLVEIGFDGYGYGGWPIREGNFNYDVAKVIADTAPKGSFLYGLGIGMPEEIVGCAKLGFNIFDCVLPTRDARHKRLYVYTAESTDKIDVHVENFYEFYTPDKEKYYQDTRPVSTACDCLLCRNYSRAYLAHLFRIEELTALRLATIHNLRFYSILMEKLIDHPGI